MNKWYKVMMDGYPVAGDRRACEVDGCPIFFFDVVMRIFDTKLIWVVPLVFGATLGILHLWKLQLDQKRYWEEQRERWKKKQEAEEARRAEWTKTMAALSPVYSHPRPARRGK